MILSFKMKGDVISDHFLMLLFQKDSLDIVSFGTYSGGPKQKSDQKVLNVPMGGPEGGDHRFRTKPVFSRLKLRVSSNLFTTHGLTFGFGSCRSSCGSRMG